MVTDREAFSLGIKKINNFCIESTQNTVSLLNGMYDCFKGNYKDLTVTAYGTLMSESLSKVGSEP
jgi:hypothetical protein